MHNAGFKLTAILSLIRGFLLVCAQLGAAQDSDVREVSICVASSWLSCFSPPKAVDALPLNEQESVRRARALIPKDKKFLNFAQRASKEQLLELLESTNWGCEVTWSVELGASPEPSRA